MLENPTYQPPAPPFPNVNSHHPSETYNFSSHDKKKRYIYNIARFLCVFRCSILWTWRQPFRIQRNARVKKLIIFFFNHSRHYITTLIIHVDADNVIIIIILIMLVSKSIRIYKEIYSFSPNFTSTANSCAERGEEIIKITIIGLVARIKYTLKNSPQPSPPPTHRAPTAVLVNSIG